MWLCQKSADLDLHLFSKIYPGSAGHRLSFRCSLSLYYCNLDLMCSSLYHWILEKITCFASLVYCCFIQIEELYKKCHAAIRADPEPKSRGPREVKVKR